MFSHRDGGVRDFDSPNCRFGIGSRRTTRLPGFVTEVFGVDKRMRVRHLCITVKTASVRDLRNHFADVAKWIEDGEKVAITRNGAVFATLAPASTPKQRRADWASRAASRKPLGRPLSANDTEAFWARLRD